MGQPSFQASNTIIYLTYGAFLSVSPRIFPFLCNSKRIHTCLKANSIPIVHAESQAYTLLGIGDASQSRSSLQPFGHRRVRIFVAVHVLCPYAHP